MTNRITSAVLEDLASKVAAATGMDVDINFSSAYGGIPSYNQQRFNHP